MIQLCHDTAGCTDPVGCISGLQIAVIVAILNRAAVIRPLADNAARIVRQIAVNRAIIDTVLNRPVACGLVGLRADDTARKAAGIVSAGGRQTRG